jgi:hypothetical protein
MPRPVDEEDWSQRLEGLALVRDSANRTSGSANNHTEVAAVLGGPWRHPFLHKLELGLFDFIIGFSIGHQEFGLFDFIIELYKFICCGYLSSGAAESMSVGIRTFVP